MFLSAKMEPFPSAMIKENNKKFYLIEYLKLEAIHKDHWVQLPAPYRTT